MAKIVNNDKLTFILTGYGLDRVAEALSDPNINIYISKIKLGSGDNYEYYEPNVTQTTLKGLIPNCDFPIVDKALLEDELTVSLHAIIPDDFGGEDIREVGVYETIENVDYLFAISTQQPFVKPSTEDNYLINIDYYAFLKAQNFAAIYDQITLDPERQTVTEEQLEELMSTILFSQSNLMDQIGHNTDIIGLDRASQLYDKIAEEKRNFGYSMTYSNYSELLDIVGNNLFSYWVFNYPRRSASTNSITDISKNGNNLSSNLPVNLYDREYFGFMPMLDFRGTNYYTLSPDVELSFLGTDPEKVKYSNSSSTPSALYNSDGTPNTDANWAIANNLVTYKDTATTYTPSKNVTVGALYTWSYDGHSIYTKDSTISATTKLYNANYTEYTGTEFAISLSSSTFVVKYLNNDTTQGTTIPAKAIYAWVYPSTVVDSDFSMIFCLEGATGTEARTLMAKSDYSSGTHVFEVKETLSNGLYVRLFSGANDYITYTISDGNIPKEKHSLILSYSHENNDLTVYANGSKKVVTKTVTGNYTHMNSSPTTIYGYSVTPEEIKYADSSSTPSALYNSDGTPNTDSHWGISNNVVIYESNPTVYTSSKNVTVGALYTWSYDQSSTIYSIYTKDSTITASTKLYNIDYTEYTGTDFVIVQSGSSYIIQYLGNNTTQGATIPAKTIYAWVYTGVTQIIWANSSSAPTVLYTSNGDVYSGTAWTVVNNTVKYNGKVAAYDSSKNKSIPSIGITSYILNNSGAKTEFVNSYVGLISISKKALTEEEIEELSLLFQATLGQNPCIEVY